MTKWERRQTALEHGEGRRLTGVVMPYKTEAVLPGGLRERFEPGAFGDLPGLDIMLNRQHDRGRALARTGAGLELIDSPTSLVMIANLPETREADDTMALVRAGVLRGLSVEFAATSERYEGRLRIIERAMLRAIAVVDDPAYRQASVAARERTAGNGLRRVWL